MGLAGQLQLPATLWRLPSSLICGSEAAPGPASRGRGLEAGHSRPACCAWPTPPQPAGSRPGSPAALDCRLAGRPGPSCARTDQLPCPPPPLQKPAAPVAEPSGCKGEEAAAAAAAGPSGVANDAQQPGGPAPESHGKLREHRPTESGGLVSNASMEESEIEAALAPETAVEEEERLRREREGQDQEAQVRP